MITPDTCKQIAGYAETVGLSIVAVLAIAQYAIGNLFDFCEYTRKRKREYSEREDK